MKKIELSNFEICLKTVKYFFFHLIKNLILFVFVFKIYYFLYFIGQIKYDIHIK